MSLLNEEIYYSPRSQDKTTKPLTPSRLNINIVWGGGPWEKIVLYFSSVFSIDGMLFVQNLNKKDNENLDFQREIQGKLIRGLKGITGFPLPEPPIFV